MGRATGEGSTTPTLVRRAGDWGDHSAWREVERRFVPLLRRWCRKFRLDPASTDELCQRILIRLSERLPTFGQDEDSNFRGWLWNLFRSRALDLLREQRQEQSRSRSIDRESLDTARWILIRAHEDEVGGDRTELIREAEDVMTAVRSRVHPENWDLFWKIEIEGWTVSEAAEHRKKSYAAAYQAHSRIVRMLKDEVARRRGQSDQSP